MYFTSVRLRKGRNHSHQQLRLQHGLLGAKIKLFSGAFLAYLALVFSNRRFCTQLAWKCNPHEKKKCKTLKIASLFQLTSHDLAQILRNRFGCLPKLDLDHEHVETITQRLHAATRKSATVLR